MGKTAVNTFDIFHALGSNAAALAVVGDAWDDNVVPELPVEFIFKDAVLTGPTPVSVSYNTPGGWGGNGQSINSCYLIDKNMDSGRRGRVFLAGVREDEVLPSGALVAAAAPRMTAAMDAFLAQVNAGSVELRIERADGSFSTIESFSCQGTIATQRRRMRR